MSERRFLIREGYVEGSETPVSLAVCVNDVAVVVSDDAGKLVCLYSATAKHLASIAWPPHVENGPDALQWFFDAVMPVW